jgi:hypothetical protein
MCLPALFDPSSSDIPNSKSETSHTEPIIEQITLIGMIEVLSSGDTSTMRSYKREIMQRGSHRIG